MSDPVASLDWSLHVSCPKCNHENNIAKSEHDTESRIAHYIFSNDWDKLNGWEVQCEQCQHEFKIEKVEY